MVVFLDARVEYLSFLGNALTYERNFGRRKSLAAELFTRLAWPGGVLSCSGAMGMRTRRGDGVRTRNG